MALTRAQLLMGNSTQGTVLSGQVQGVTSGPGLTIDSNGSIQINSQTVIGVMKLGQSPTAAAAAFNGYTWPTTAGTIGQQLATNGSGVLSWSDPDGLAWTAKGELVVGTGVDTQTFLTVGTNGQILVANSATASGLAYTSNYVSTSGATTAAFLPAGTTANRPSLTAGQAGALRYNASTVSMEFWNGTAWEEVASNSVTGFVRETSTTGSAVMPAGPDGSRDASPAAGYTRFNTTSASLEVWNGTAWTLVGAPPTGGLGISVTGSIVKVSISTSSSPPAVGGGAAQAVVGSLFWNDVLGQLFIYYSNGGTPTWVQAAPAAGGGGGGTVTGVTGTAPIVSSGGTAPAISITPATSGAAGSMSAADKAKLDGAATIVSSVTGTLPITVATGTSTPLIGINAATTAAAGSVQLATAAESAAGTVATKAATPAFSVPKDASGMTGAALIPTGTSLQKPGTPVVGMQRFNTDTGYGEIYANSTDGWKKVAWQAVPEQTTDLVYAANATLSGGVYLCRNLTINAGVTLTSGSQSLVFVCSGNATINGNISLDGAGPAGTTVPYSTNGSFVNAIFGVGFGSGEGNIYFPSLSIVGSGGGSGPTLTTAGSTVYGSAGGVGGGGLIIKAAGNITQAATSTISAKGGNAGAQSGGVGGFDAAGGGGGSGGSISFNAGNNLTVAGTIDVRGGNGQAGVSNTAGASGGGGGGGGTIILQRGGSLTDSSTKLLNGGTGGAGVAPGAIGGTAGASGAGVGGLGGNTLVAPFSINGQAGGAGAVLDYGSPL